MMALAGADRLREEDPFTAGWTSIAENRLVGSQSRFEVDLNRPREKAVYLHPEDAWGLHVWKEPPPPEVIEGSLAVYDAFYEEARRLFTELESRFGRFVAFDLHTYNHRREGPGGPIADVEGNPEVNLGTGTMDRNRWTPVVECFLKELSAFDFLGRQLDVRENVRFRGGQLARWTHAHFPGSGCVLAIEIKKFFMDEWTGIPDSAQLEAIKTGLRSTIPGVLEALGEV
jgi:N-formylglutamate amidohydrolase